MLIKQYSYFIKVFNKGICCRSNIIYNNIKKVSLANKRKLLFTLQDMNMMNIKNKNGPNNI